MAGGLLFCLVHKITLECSVSFELTSVEIMYNLMVLAFSIWYFIILFTLTSASSFVIGKEIRLSFLTVEVLVVFLGFISVLAVAVSLSTRHRPYLNQILILHTLGKCLQERVSRSTEKCWEVVEFRDCYFAVLP